MLFSWLTALSNAPFSPVCLPLTIFKLKILRKFKFIETFSWSCITGRTVLTSKNKKDQWDENVQVGLAVPVSAKRKWVDFNQSKTNMMWNDRLSVSPMVSINSSAERFNSLEMQGVLEVERQDHWCLYCRISSRPSRPRTSDVCGLLQLCEDLFNRINDTPDVTHSVEVVIRFVSELQHTLSPGRLVRPSVCLSHGRISQKSSKLRLWNFRHTVDPSN